MNIHTRNTYNELRDQSVITQKPLKYITDVFNNYNLVSEKESPDTSSELRMKPTVLNDTYPTNTTLYGTSAYIASGLQNPIEEINIETSLLHAEPSLAMRKNLTEKSHFRNEYLDIPLSDDSLLRGTSTRADMRNSYKKFNCYKQRN